MDKLNPAKIKNCFRTFASGTADAIAWREYFENLNHDAWSEEQSGILVYLTEKERYTLNIVYVDREKFVVEHMCSDSVTARSIWSFYAVEQKEQLNIFDEVDEGYIVPQGCVIGPATAWKVVEDFLHNATVPSSRVFMINSCSIDWPESLE